MKCNRANLRNEKIGNKIREAQVEKVPYMLIMGNKEMENQTVAVRAFKAGDLGVMGVDEFVAKVVTEVKNKVR
jgi:threonyl-tRNA synthetase